MSGRRSRWLCTCGHTCECFSCTFNVCTQLTVADCRLRPTRYANTAGRYRVSERRCFVDSIAGNVRRRSRGGRLLRRWLAVTDGAPGRSRTLTLWVLVWFGWSPSGRDRSGCRTTDTTSPTRALRSISRKARYCRGLVAARAPQHEALRYRAEQISPGIQMAGGTTN